MIDQKKLEGLFLDPSFIFERFNTSFDVPQLLATHQSIVTAIRPMVKDQNERYEGYSLQSDDERDQDFGSLNQTRVHADDHSYVEIKKFFFHKKRNLWGDRFSSVFQKFPFSLYQGRVLIARPQCKIPMHNDGLYRLTMHVPLQTNKGCYFEINGHLAHLPADGSTYILNTRLPHNFLNAGTEDRIHLVFSLWPICIESPSVDFLKEFGGFYEKARAYGI